MWDIHYSGRQFIKYRQNIFLQNILRNRLHTGRMMINDELRKDLEGTIDQQH